MPKTARKLFSATTRTKAHDKDHRSRINFNMGRYHSAVSKGKALLKDEALARRVAGSVRREAIANLGDLLLEWERNFTRRGGKVIWASTVEDAQAAFTQILKDHPTKLVVKSKSMITEEVSLNHHLERLGVDSVETDLGEYIQQLDGERPYHIVTPAMHKSRADISDLFHRKLGTPPDSSAEFLTGIARERLREKYLEAGIGVTGVNFLLADSGGILVLENEGNARLCAGIPPVHVAIAGIERILPHTRQLSLMLPMLSTYGTGQPMTNYNTLYFGPKKKGEGVGPEHMYVILLDANRTQLLAEDPQREALACIRCGACLNACPVYKNIGGHSYAKTYTGPIGSVITPYYDGYHDFVHLSYASSLCGNCSEACPVNINLHGHLLRNRHKAVRQEGGSSERTVWQLWQTAMSSRSLMDAGPSRIKNTLLSYLLRHSWGHNRSPVKLERNSFSQSWKKRRGIS